MRLERSGPNGVEQGCSGVQAGGVVAGVQLGWGKGIAVLGQAYSGVGPGVQRDWSRNIAGLGQGRARQHEFWPGPPHS